MQILEYQHKFTVSLSKTVDQAEGAFEQLGSPLRMLLVTNLQEIVEPQFCCSPSIPESAASRRALRITSASGA